MGNKISSSPFPSFDVSCSHLSSNEIIQIKENFLIKSEKKEFMELSHLLKTSSSLCSEYILRHVIMKLFTVIDTKKDGVIDFEEYFCAVCLFRIGNIEEKIKIIFAMYEQPTKLGFICRDNLKELIIDSTISIQKITKPIDTLERWIDELDVIAEGMVEMALHQFSHHENKMDINDFNNFAKVEGSIQKLLSLLSKVIDN